MALNDLKKFSTTVLREATVEDPRQITAADVLVDVYRRGATVSSGGIVAGSGGTLVINVYDTGDLEEFDTVKVGTSPVDTLTVFVITNSTTITVRNDNVDPITIEQGDRLVILNNRPIIYLESTGVVVNPGTTGRFMVGANGLVEFYLKETVFDWIVMGTGITTSLYVNEESGNVERNFVNVKNFPTFQEALDELALNGGGVFYVPTGFYGDGTVPRVNVEGLTWGSLPMIFKGDGIGRTRILHDGVGASSTDLLTVSGGNSVLTIQDVSFLGAAVAGDGAGLHLHNVHGANIERCDFTEFPAEALKVTTSGGIDSVDNRFNNCRFQNSHGGASPNTKALIYLGPQTFAHKFTSCPIQAVNYPLIAYVHLDGTSDGHQFYTCTFEGLNDRPMVWFRGNVHMHPLFDNCWFEDHTAIVTPTSAFIEVGIPAVETVNVNGLTIRHCHFVRGDLATTSLKILKSQGSGGPYVGGWIQGGIIEAPNAVIASGVSVGLADIDLGPPNKITMLGEDFWTAPGASALTPLTITHGDSNGGLIRLGSAKRNKFKAITAAEFALLTNVFVGDLILLSNEGGLGFNRLMFRVAGAWATLNVIPMTQANAATIAGGIGWQPGDRYYQTDVAAPGIGLYVCSVAPGTFHYSG